MTHRAKLQCQVNPRVAVQIQIRNKTIGAIEVGSVKSLEPFRKELESRESLVIP